MFGLQKKSDERGQFDSDYGEILNDFIEFVNDLVFCVSIGPLDVDNLISHLLKMVRKKKYSNSILSLLQDVYVSDCDSFVHSLNVALICYEMSSWLGFSRADQEVAALSGLMHDVGKLKIPKEILLKPGVLTKEERAQMERHTIDGYHILMKFKGMNTHVCNAALMHHERCDGSGYPVGLISLKIDKFAKLVSVADVYDAMTVKRVYRPAMEPVEVIKYINTNSAYFDKDVVAVLTKHVNTIIK